MYNICVKKGSARIVQKRFWHKFPDVTIVYKETIHIVVNKTNRVITGQKNRIKTLSGH
jgi:hypothetical protein